MRIGRPAQTQVIDCLVASPTPAARAAAALVLGHVGARSADRHLVRALDDPDDGVKLAATLMLGSRRCPEAVPGLLRILTRGRFDDPSAPHPDQLALALPGVEVYGEVLESADGGHDGAVSHLRAPSLDALVAPYERGLADDAAAYLEVMSAAGAAERLSIDGPRDKVVPVWVTAPWRHWNTDELREAAALSLGRIGDSRAVESLAWCADDEDEPLMLRAYAIDALGVIGDDRGFDVVYDALRRGGARRRSPVRPGQLRRSAGAQAAGAGGPVRRQHQSHQRDQRVVQPGRSRHAALSASSDLRPRYVHRPAGAEGLGRPRFAGGSRSGRGSAHARRSRSAAAGRCRSALGAGAEGRAEVRVDLGSVRA